MRKRVEISTLSAASYKICVDSTLLDTLIFSEEFATIAPNAQKSNDLTSYQIKTYLDGIVKTSSGRVNPEAIKNHQARTKHPMIQGRIQRKRHRNLQSVAICHMRRK